MRILLLVHSFNSLSQSVYTQLRSRGHEVTVEFDINHKVLDETISSYTPDLILAPFLKRAIPDHIWRRIPCFIIHPGIPGDRGPSALDWAILNNEKSWGVTILQADAEMDAGPIWAACEFKMRPATKSSLYKNEVTEAALEAVNLALDRFESGTFTPLIQQPDNQEIKGISRPEIKQADRRINWFADDTETIARKIRSADGMPGVKTRLLGQSLYLFDAHADYSRTGNPGDVIAKSGAAICIATIDGAIWIGHVTIKNSRHPFKLPATHALSQSLTHLTEIPEERNRTYREISYDEQGEVGFLRFNFYNGAMSKAQCHSLKNAYEKAASRPTKIIILLGGEDFWSNGMHLNLIEAAPSAADESWENINAIDDVTESIIRTESHLTIAALNGNAGAGGVFLARATDYVWLRQGIILNPHYKDMGNLYGSEFWTYLLPRYAGVENAARISKARLPMGADEAVSLGLADECFNTGRKDFLTTVRCRAEAMAASPEFDRLLQQKTQTRTSEEAKKPLSSYRKEELKKMRQNFYGFDPSYHIARYNFVYKVPKSRTPLTIARHRNAHSHNQGEAAQ